MPDFEEHDVLEDLDETIPSFSYEPIDGDVSDDPAPDDDDQLIEQMLSDLAKFASHISLSEAVCYVLMIAISVATFIIYTWFIDTGLVEISDKFSTRLSDFGLLGFLDWFELTREAQLSTVMAILIYCGVSSSLKDAIRQWAVGEGSEMFDGLPELAVRREWFLYFRAFLLFNVDLMLTYKAVAAADWGGSPVSGTALFVCLIYGSVLLSSASTVVRLQSKLERMKNESQNSMA